MEWCGRWRTLRAGGYYLAPHASDMKKIMEMHGDK